MNRFLRLCAAIVFLAVSAIPALAQATGNTQCRPGENWFAEYDFETDSDGIATLQYELRLPVSICARDKPSRIGFRGVDAPFKSREQIRDALRAAEAFLDAEITDVETIKQLIARVAKMREDQAARSKEEAKAEGKPQGLWPWTQEPNIRPHVTPTVPSPAAPSVRIVPIDPPKKEAAEDGGSYTPWRMWTPDEQQKREIRKK